jgi:aminoglycoside N3'-acetyltransferase
MPIPTTTSAQFHAHLEALELQEHRNVVVHSRLLSFGRIERGAATIHECLSQSIGSQGTIAAPSYTLQLGEHHPYDAAASSGAGAGALGEYIRRLPGAVRSGCPLHNHVAVGPIAAILGSLDGTRSMGPGSDFEALRRSDFSLLLLGCRFSEGATFLHHLEAMAGVPYRRWLDLPRKRLVDGTEQSITVRYYARASDEWVEDFDAVGGMMERAGLLRTAACPFGSSVLVPLRTVEEFVMPLLQRDPYALVKRVEASVHGE